MKKEAFVLVDLGFGDSGKGSLVDFLAFEKPECTKAVIRYSGGAQAAHNVVLPDGRHHTFAQFGSGTFLHDCLTYLGPEVITCPTAMIPEEKHLQEVGVNDAFDRLYIHKDALVITYLHQAMNQLREIARGKNRHGSCGIGVGETKSHSLEMPDDAIRIGDLKNSDLVYQKLLNIKKYLCSEFEKFSGHAFIEESDIGQSAYSVLFHADLKKCAEELCEIAQRFHTVDWKFEKELFLHDGRIIFEPSQGVLLDEWYGFHPFTTWATVTTKHADEMLERVKYDGKVIRWGITRAIPSRHGAGPFVTECDESNFREKGLIGEHNCYGQWQGDFRLGHFDLLMTQYAIESTKGIDGLVITCLDRVLENHYHCVSSYNFDGHDDGGLAEFFHYKESQIKKILVKHCEDIQRLEQLTNYIQGMKPHINILKSEEDFLKYIEGYLNIPIVMTSHGNTRIEKKYYSK